MIYKTIFQTKPKKENKKRFCQRICNLLNEIEVVNNSNSNILKGKSMLDFLFKYSPFNDGYTDIIDLLKEANDNYNSIFDLCLKNNDNILDIELFANIEIIVNCFYCFKSNEYGYGYFYRKDSSSKNIEILFSAIKNFLLEYGLKLIQSNGKLNIVENEISINIEEIEDEKLKNEIVSFYDYKNANDIDEKRKIILLLIGKLENRKNDISNILGAKISDMYANYANNLNLRHNNISEEYKKYYNPKVAELNNEEIIEWYDYIFAFILNIYLNIDKLKNINVNNGYK